MKGDKMKDYSLLKQTDLFYQNYPTEITSLSKVHQNIKLDKDSAQCKINYSMYDTRYSTVVLAKAECSEQQNQEINS